MLLLVVSALMIGLTVLSIFLTTYYWAHLGWLDGVFFLFALMLLMIGAIIAHLAILGPSAMPAAVLGLLAGVALYAHRHEIGRPRA